MDLLKTSSRGLTNSWFFINGCSVLNALGMDIAVVFYTTHPFISWNWLRISPTGRLSCLRSPGTSPPPRSLAVSGSPASGNMLEHTHARDAIGAAMLHFVERLSTMPEWFLLRAWKSQSRRRRRLQLNFRIRFYMFVACNVIVLRGVENPVSSRSYLVHVRERGRLHARDCISFRKIVAPE